MDDAAQYNRERWEELAKANVMFSQPWLDLDKTMAVDRVDPEGFLGPVEGKDVLCLAGGGGQQSVAFALLGANVTVLDISPTQLERDRQAAKYYGLRVRTIEADMRDFSAFREGAFDVVVQPHSLNFVPDAHPVFAGVAKILREHGIYHFTCTNPFVHGIRPSDWSGDAYPLKRPYVDGAEVFFDDPCWTIDGEDGQCARIRGPKEFRHCLSTIVNGLVDSGFEVWRVLEETGPNEHLKPATWQHLFSIAALWLRFWTHRGSRISSSMK